MATEAIKSLSWRYGNTEELTLRYTNKDSTPVDLTGYTGILSLSSDVLQDTSDLEITASWPDGESQGLLTFQISEAQTRTLVPDGVYCTTYHYAVELVNDTIPVKKTILSGKIKVERAAYVG